MNVWREWWHCETRFHPIKLHTFLVNLSSFVVGIFSEIFGLNFACPSLMTFLNVHQKSIPKSIKIMPKCCCFCHFFGPSTMRLKRAAIYGEKKEVFTPTATNSDLRFLSDFITDVFACVFVWQTIVFHFIVFLFFTNLSRGFHKNMQTPFLLQFVLLF